MSGLIGDVITVGGTAVYVKHPAALAGWTENGTPLSSAAAAIVQSNVSQLSSESLRPWVYDWGPGTLNKYSGTGYDSLRDFGGDPTADTTQEYQQISWDRRTARRHGPFPAVVDWPMTAASATGYGPRKLRVKLDVSQNSANSLKLYAALTDGLQFPTEGPLALATWAPGATTGRQQSTLDLAVAALPPGGLRPAPVRCRSDGTYAGVTAYEFGFYVWVGWRSTDTANALISTSIFETR